MGTLSLKKRLHLPGVVRTWFYVATTERLRVCYQPQKKRLHLPGVVRTWFYVATTERIRVCYRPQNIVYIIIMTYGVHAHPPAL